MPSYLHNVIQVKPLSNYCLWVSFDDGTSGEADFSEWKPFPGVLAPLAQPEVFSQVSIHPEHTTLMWPTSDPIDIDPAWLYCRANKLPLPQWT